MSRHSRHPAKAYADGGNAGRDLPYRLRVFLMGGRALSGFVAAHLRLSANSESPLQAR